MWRRTIAALGLIALCSASQSRGEPPAEKKAPLAFKFEHVEKDQPASPPFFRVFPDGKDVKGRDASKVLRTLKLARGASQLYREEDDKPGLIVVLRRLILIPLPGGDYQAILEGEYNAVKSVVKKETMEALFAGKRTELEFVNDTTKGIRPFAYRVSAKTSLRAALCDGKLLIYGGEGSSSITHYGLTGDATYESETVSFGPADGTAPLYQGQAVKPTLKSDGSPETLPILN